MYRFAGFWLVLMVFCAPAWAQQTIGFVKTASGDALIINSGKYVIARPGTPVALGSVIKTGATGSMGITLKDNTVMSFGSETEITLDEFLYAPAKGDLKFGASLYKGTLLMVSGVIARLKPESVVIKTPTDSLVVNGARFLVKVDQ